MQLQMQLQLHEIFLLIDRVDGVIHWIKKNLELKPTGSPNHPETNCYLRIVRFWEMLRWTC